MYNVSSAHSSPSHVVTYPCNKSLAVGNFGGTGNSDSADAFIAGVEAECVDARRGGVLPFGIWECCGVSAAAD